MSVPRTLQMNHVLIVDDDEEMTDTMVRILETLGPDRMTLYIANDPLTIRVPLEVDLIVADYSMPGASGVEVIEGVRRIHPDVRAILVTGYSDLEIAAEAINRARVDHFLTKPFNAEELVTVVAEVLAEKRTADLRTRSFSRAQRLLKPSD
ncbi:MAG: response regulator [Euryarchaeota archaeon]|nr:response regulator [Euryarchaeota archaeon]